MPSVRRVRPSCKMLPPYFCSSIPAFRMDKRRRGYDLTTGFPISRRQSPMEFVPESPTAG